jgi:uncharacterized membrane protein
MTYARTFLPWIVYAVVPSGSWRWGALAALLVAVALVVQQRRTGRPADAVIIETGSAVFFAALTVVAFADPHSGLHPYTAGLSNAMLALIAGISLAIHRPFTLGIAKQTTPREYWGLPAFVRTNVIITSVWTAAFVVTAIVLTLLAHAGHGRATVTVVIQIAGLVLPMLFTKAYVARVQTRAQAHAQAG